MMKIDKRIKNKMNVLLHNTILGGLVLLIFSFMSGCSDSEAELKITQLNGKLIQLREANKNLKSSQSKKDTTIEKLNLKLSTLKDDNTDTKILIAKAEQVFAEKHKEQIKNERDELSNERKKIESDVRNEYKGYLAIFFFIIVFIAIFLFFNKKKDSKLILDKSKKIEELEKLNDDNKKKELEFEKEMSNLSRDIIELNKKIKEGEKSQVVTKIEECENRRDKQLKRIGIENA